MGEGAAYGGLPVPYIGCPVPDVYIIMRLMINVWETVYTFINLPWMLPPTDILFWTTDWMILNGPPLHQSCILNLG